MAVLLACAIADVRAPALLAEALRKASFVGHDSSGLAATSEGRLVVWKKPVPIEELLREFEGEISTTRASVCLGHARWATHGAPQEANTHPLLDCRGELALAHNGIVENFADLRKELRASGHNFVSKTDSEVLAHIVGARLASGLKPEEALAEALTLAEGSIATAFLWLKEPTSVFCACKNSRLFLGRGSKGCFCSSELSCLHGLADRYAELEGGEMAILRPEGIEVFKLSGLEPIEKAFEPLEVSLEEARGQGHPHLTLREIWEQFYKLQDSLRLQEPYLSQMARLLATSEELFLVGRGSSYNACLAASYLFSFLAYKAAHAVRLAEFLGHYGDALNVATTVLVADDVGGGPELEEVVRLAKSRGATVLGITNKLGSFLTHMARLYLCQHSGPPLGVISMRTFTAQVLVFIQLALKMAELKGKVGHVELEEHLEALKGVPELVRKTIETSEEAAKKAAREYAKKSFFFVLGRGLGYPTALEGLQKLMEVAGIGGLSYPAGESKHGPISLIEEGFPVIFVCQMDETHEALLGNIMEMRARGARIITVAEEGDEEARELSHAFLPVPSNVPTFLTPIIYAIPLQLFAYYCSLARGLNPDARKSTMAS